MSSFEEHSENEEFTKQDFRSYMKICSRLGESAINIHKNLVTVAGDKAPSERTVRDWVSRYKAGRTSTEDDSRSGRPSEVQTPSIIDFIESTVTENPHITIDEIADLTGISHGAAYSILHDQLRLKKLSSRWVPHILTDAQREERVEIAQSLTNKFRRWGNEGMNGVVTGDETYVYYYEPKSRTESLAWRRSNDLPLIQQAPSHFTDKVLYTIFFCKQGEVARIVSPKGTTVTGKFYAETVLPQVVTSFRSQHPNHRLRLHHDNAPSHRHRAVIDYLAQENIELVPHPPYSPDIAPCDFWLFPKLKSHLRGQQFHSRQGLGGVVGMVLHSIPEEEWSYCYKEWSRRLKLCVEHHGHYFEVL